MPERTLAGSLGLTGDWDLGQDGWKDQNDLNLLKLSVTVQGRALELVSATPGAPTEGDVYLFDDTHPTQPGKIGVYDEATWKYITPSEGWRMWDVDSDFMREFNGTTWIEVTSGGGGSIAIEDEGSPVDAAVTTINFTGSGVTATQTAPGEVEVNITGGGGGGGGWELVFRPVNNEPPTANYATLDTRNNHPVLDFDTATQEAAIFTGVLPSSYGGAGIVVKVFVAMTSATSGTVGFDVAIERIDASSLDIDSDSFATAQTIVATTVPGTSGQILALSVNIANGADMDNLAAGELFRLRLRRDVANDTATGDAEVLAVSMREQ